MMATVNDTLKFIITTGLEDIPEVEGLEALSGVGGLISSLVGFLWQDSSLNVWDEIKAQVEALIGEKIGQNQYNNVTNFLKGFESVLTNYYADVDEDDVVYDDYKRIRDQFDAARPTFKSEGTGYEVLMLPLLAQFANLHITFLRDNINNGADWYKDDPKFKPEFIDDIKNEQKGAIQDYGNWVTTYYNKGLQEVKIPSSSKHKSTVKWKAINNYIRGMTLQVLDSAFYWPYFDPDNQDPLPRQRREIYSDPIGSADTHGINLTASLCSPRISNLRIWGDPNGYVSAVQHAFDGVWEPQPAGIAGWDYAKSSGGGWDGPVTAGNPVNKVTSKSGDLPDQLQLFFQNGGSTNLCGRSSSNASKKTWQYDSHILSRIHLTGLSGYYGTAECFVLGFRYEDSFGDRYNNFSGSKTVNWTVKLDGAFDKAGTHSGSTTVTPNGNDVIVLESVKSNGEKIRLGFRYAFSGLVAQLYKYAADGTLALHTCGNTIGIGDCSLATWTPYPGNRISVTFADQPLKRTIAWNVYLDESFQPNRGSGALEVTQSDNPVIVFDSKKGSYNWKAGFIFNSNGLRGLLLSMGNSDLNFEGNLVKIDAPDKSTAAWPAYNWNQITVNFK